MLVREQLEAVRLCHAWNTGAGTWQTREDARVLEQVQPITMFWAQTPRQPDVVDTDARSETAP
jgi:hypothetical protein